MVKESQQTASKHGILSSRRYSDQEREAYLNEYHQSGLSPWQYARDKPFTQDTFKRWLKASQANKPKTSATKSDFLKIQMDTSSKHPMVIKLPYGCSIEIFHQSQIRWALDLMNAHMETSC